MLIPALIVSPQQIATSATVYYTSPVGVRTIIYNATVCNTSGTARAVTIYLVPLGGTAGASNTVISASTVAAGATYKCPELVGKVLDVGGTLQALAAVSSTALTLDVAGLQVTP